MTEGPTMMVGPSAPVPLGREVHDQCVLVDFRDAYIAVSAPRAGSS